MHILISLHLYKSQFIFIHFFSNLGHVIQTNVLAGPVYMFASDRRPIILTGTQVSGLIRFSLFHPVLITKFGPL